MRGGLIFALAMLLQLPATQAEEAPRLAEIFSDSGILSATLMAEAGKVHIGNLEFDGATYNGAYSGPVLHVHPGELMRLRLVNHLSQPTNLHFHGMRTSPLGNSDNPHLIILPNETFTYEVRVPPTQPAGLFWYHAHIHGLGEQQIMAGLSGTIVIEPSVPVPLTQRLFILKDMIFDDETGNDEVDGALHGIVQSVNGGLLATEAMRPGETQLWRFSNQSANRALHLVMSGHRFRIVAEDGEPVADERFVEVLEMTPGARFDVLMDGVKAGHFPLLAKGIMTGTGTARLSDRVIGYLDVAGDAVAPSVAIHRGPLPPDLRAVRIDAARDVAFSQTTTSVVADQHFFVNGRMFEPDRMDVRVKLGSTEEWTIRNDSDDMHVFHIHQMGFQVVELNGMPVPFAGYVDTVRVPERGSVKLRLPFTDPLILGRFMFHCHVLRHEDKGMMANIEVYDPAMPSLADRLNRLYSRVLWWWQGVPWSLCGLADT
jgi:FtsP/CotA-like multicopper oxidase with cupredoxin domain